MSFVDDGLKMRMSVRKTPTLPPMLRKISLGNASVARPLSRMKSVEIRRMKNPSVSAYRLFCTNSLVEVIQITHEVSRYWKKRGDGRGISPLKQRRLLICPENVAQRVGDLSDRRVGAHGVEDERHRVRGGLGGGIPQRLQRLLDPPPVARGADPVQG